MKITVICASRHRPVSLIGAVKNLDMLESGLHEVSYGIVCDDDDPVTLQSANLLQADLAKEVKVFQKPRDLVTKRINEAAREMPADLYLPYADDCFCLSPMWDEICVRTAERVPAFSWLEYGDPMNVTLLTVTNKWLESVGYLLSEYFPFWMSDTWIQEQYAFAFAQPIGLVRQLSFAGRRGKTRQLNDVRFWFEFFAAKRTERINEGRKLRKDVGEDYKGLRELEHITDEALKGFIEAFEIRDRSQIENSPKYEEWFHSGEKRSDSYMGAFERAKAFMDERQKVAA